MNGSQSSRVATFTPLSRVQAMLDVEVALAEALAEAAVIPISSVAPIRTAARAEMYDLASLAEESERAGNLLIPLVQQLRMRVAAADPEAAGHVHWGATSQDVMDTALVLQLGTAVGDILASLDWRPAARPLSRGATRPRRWRAAPGCSRPHPRRLV